MAWLFRSTSLRGASFTGTSPPAIFWWAFLHFTSLTTHLSHIIKALCWFTVHIPVANVGRSSQRFQIPTLQLQVTPVTGPEHVKVGDFGLAKQGAATGGHFCYSVQTMELPLPLPRAPEALGDPVTGVGATFSTRSDV